MLRVNILESDQEIISRLYTAYASALSKHFNEARPKVFSQLSPVISRALSDSPEIQSLSSGTLKADFGLTSNPSSTIISAIIGSIQVTTQRFRSTGRTISGGLTINMQPKDYSNLLSLPIASQAIQGGSLPWLKWLLTLGDTIIIANFGVEYGPYGRSGGGKMTQRSRPFKVNSAFSGTVDDNFISRAIDRNLDDIKNSIIKALT